MGWRDAPLVEVGAEKWRIAPLMDRESVVTATDALDAVDRMEGIEPRSVVPEPKTSDGYGDSHVAQALSGANEGIGEALGAPVDIINSALGVVGLGSDKPILGSGQINDVLSAIGAIKPETDDPTKRFIRRASKSVGASLPFGMGASVGLKSGSEVAKVLGGTLASGATGGIGAATAQQLFPDNPLAEFVGEIIGSGAPMTLAALAKRARAATAAPTVKQLEDEAGRLYEQAENSGVMFDQSTVAAKVNDIAARAMSEGIDPTLHPGATAALKRLTDASSRGLTVKEARTLRKVIGAAEKDFTNGDQVRIAGIMRRQFDELLNTVPELRPANALYARASKGDMIETAIELAGSRAGQFTGSGFENALRTEFRALDRQIIRGELKGLSEAEIAAIRKIARGGNLENALRGLGKLAPTGVVSMGMGGGLPFLVGNALGGPAMGAAAAGATMGAGMAGRAGATALQKRNAAVASALARRGGPVARQPLLTERNSRVAAALAGGAAANL